MQNQSRPLNWTELPRAINNKLLKSAFLKIAMTLRARFKSFSILAHVIISSAITPYVLLFTNGKGGPLRYDT